MSEETKTVRLSDLVNVYETDFTLPSGRKLKVKPITTGQLKSLLIYENETNPVVIEDALDDVMAKSVISDEFSIDDLYLNDRLDLMLELRKITKGSIYTFTHKCDSCEGESIITKDLKELVTLPMKESTFKLDVTDRLSIVMGFPTRGIQKKANMFQGAYDTDAVIDSLKMADISTTVMAYSIQDIIIDGESIEAYQGDSEMTEKIYMLDNLSRASHDKLTAFYNDNRFGTDFQFDFNCKFCKKKFNMNIPINDFFV